MSRITKKELRRRIHEASHRIGVLGDSANDVKCRRLERELRAAREAFYRAGDVERKRLQEDIVAWRAELLKQRAASEFHPTALAWVRTNEIDQRWKIKWTSPDGKWLVLTWPGHMMWAGIGRTSYFETHHMLFRIDQSKRHQNSTGFGLACKKGRWSTTMLEWFIAKSKELSK